MEELLKSKWDEILNYLRIEYEIGEISFKTWIQALSIYSVQDHHIVIAIDDAKIGTNKEYIMKKYATPLMVSISEIMNEPFDLEFEFLTTLQKQSAASDMNPVSSNNKESNLQAISKNERQVNLNPNYTFDTFVVGNSNNLAYAAAVAVAESPGKIYNPLFIYGGVGLGKTHLMQSIAHYIVDHNPTAVVRYVTSETFTNELIEAIRNRNKSKDDTSITEFRNKYRNVDVLLIDDIQFIIGKESTQEEFFHTFNALYEMDKEIIISSDKHPNKFETLEERLSSRFASGLPVDIQTPNYETRMAILRRKEEAEHLSMDDKVLDYIATHIDSNVRELEGALTRVVASAKLTKREINLEMVEDVLKDYILPNAKREITVELITDIVAEHYGIHAADILSSKKTRTIANPRQVCMYLCREYTNNSLKEIGEKLGGRDHTTVLHGCNKIAEDMQHDSSLKNNIDILVKKINPQ